MGSFGGAEESVWAQRTLPNSEAPPDVSPPILWVFEEKERENKSLESTRITMEAGFRH